MVEKGIIEPVKYSQWASPIVVVPKTSGLRICVDCKKTINRFIEMEHYPLPRMDDIFAQLANCEYFCVIDLSKAYLQLQVSVSSQEYLTINTHKGLYRYKRLPFGVASAPSAFQSVMDQVLLGLKGVCCYLDDVLIGGEDFKACQQRLLDVLNRLNYYNIKINLDKCNFFVKEVNFLGHSISKKGIKPKKDKMEAIMQAPAPKDLLQLQSYLGLLNYYGRFIPNLSMELSSLYKLLKKGVKFQWTATEQEAFERSKHLLNNNDILELYDPNKPIIVSADGSPDGVGAILSHLVDGVEKPVLFASSTLSVSEKNYAQLHREALAIIFAVKKFHKYIYGKHFTLQSDSQALREIFSPSKGTSTVAISRLQRWSVLMSMYNYTFKHKPAKEMRHADALSRLPLPIPTSINCFQINRLAVSDNCPINFEIVKKSQLEDKLIKVLFKFTKYGWPTIQDAKLKYYFKLRNDFSIEDSALFYCDRIVVPSSLVQSVLKLLHECHTGIVRMKMVSRSYVWWSGMSKDIEDYVKSCAICQKTQNVSKELVVTKWPICSSPFERIHIDFFHLEGKVFLIVVDAYSKFIDVKIMHRTDAKSVIKELKCLFSYFGLPKIIVSDNGPPFNSQEFIEFGQVNSIEIVKSPPFHPQSNGLGERGVQTCKKVLKRLILENRNVSIEELVREFLCCYRTTPSTATSKSPADMIFSYKCRTCLSNLNPKNKVTKSEEIKSPNQSPKVIEQKRDYFKNKEVFKPGEKVLYRNHFKNDIKWIPAVVLSQISSVVYQIKVSGGTRTVHEKQLRKSTLMDQFHPSIDPVVPVSHNSNVTPPNRNHKRKSSSVSSPFNQDLRRSKRVRNRVVKFDFQEYKSRNRTKSK